MSKLRYFIGQKEDGSWESFSTDKCTDPQGWVNLPALAEVNGYKKCNGEYVDINSAKAAAKKA